MKMVIRTNYYDYCNSWDDDRYIAYESTEKFYVDFCKYCDEAEAVNNGSEDGFLGLRLYSVHREGDEQHGQIQIYTYDQWWELNVIELKGEY